MDIMLLLVIMVTLSKWELLIQLKVTRSALQNAASVAGLVLTTDAMIADAPKRR